MQEVLEGQTQLTPEERNIRDYLIRQVQDLPLKQLGEMDVETVGLGVQEVFDFAKQHLGIQSGEVATPIHTEILDKKTDWRKERYPTSRDDVYFEEWTARKGQTTERVTTARQAIKLGSRIKISGLEKTTWLNHLQNRSCEPRQNRTVI